MSEKRFVISSESNQNIYDTEEKCYYSSIDAMKLCELLNELHEDNQLLHKMNAETIDFMYDNFDMNRMFTDRELNDICNEQGLELSEKEIKIDQLEKENEQLKKVAEEFTQKPTQHNLWKLRTVLKELKGDV